MKSNTGSYKHTKPFMEEDMLRDWIREASGATDVFKGLDASEYFEGDEPAAGGNKAAERKALRDKERQEYNGDEH